MSWFWYVPLVLAFIPTLSLEGASAAVSVPRILLSAEELSPPLPADSGVTGYLNFPVATSQEIAIGESFNLRGTTSIYWWGLGTKGCGYFRLDFVVELQLTLCPVQLPHGVVQYVLVVDVSGADLRWDEKKECKRLHYTGGRESLPLQFGTAEGGPTEIEHYPWESSYHEKYEVTDWDGWFFFPETSGSLCGNAQDNQGTDVKNRRAILVVNSTGVADRSTLGALTLRWGVFNYEFAYRITLTYSHA